MRTSIKSIVFAAGLLTSLSCHAAVVDYQLTFNAVTGPSGTGSFQYDATPGAEWMSDIAIDFGPGLTATIITEYDPAITFTANEDLFLFEIFSEDWLPRWLRADSVADYPSLLGVTTVVDGAGFSWIDFSKDMRVDDPWGRWPSIRLPGAFYVFGGPDVPDPYYYGTISLSSVPIPAALPLLGSALGVLGWIGRRGRGASGEFAPK